MQQSLSGPLDESPAVDGRVAQATLGPPLAEWFQVAAHHDHQSTAARSPTPDDVGSVVHESFRTEAEPAAAEQLVAPASPSNTSHGGLHREDSTTSRGGDDIGPEVVVPKRPAVASRGVYLFSLSDMSTESAPPQRPGTGHSYSNEAVSPTGDPRDGSSVPMPRAASGATAAWSAAAKAAAAADSGADTPPLSLRSQHDNLDSLRVQWLSLRSWVMPFEPNTIDYLDANKYPPGGCRRIEVHPRLASKLLEQCGGSLAIVARLLSEALYLELFQTTITTTAAGSPPGPGLDRGSQSATPSGQMTSVAARVDGAAAVSIDDAGCGISSGKVSPQLSTSAASVNGGAGQVALRDTIGFLLRPMPRLGATVGQEALATTAVVQRSSGPTSVATVRRVSGVAAAAIRSSPLVNTAAAAASSNGTTASGGPSRSSGVSASLPIPPRVLFEDEGSPIDRIRELEAEVRDLSRQLRTFQVERDTMRNSASTSPTNQVVISSMRPAVVAAGVATTVKVTVSTTLDADLAPYSIKVGRNIVPCIVSDRRVLSFVTPTLPPGSTPIQVMCTTAQGSVRRYGRAVWLECKVGVRVSTVSMPTANHHDAHGVVAGATASSGFLAVASQPRLTRHAVNQLGPEVPMASTMSTMRDPSEAGRSAVETATAKSETFDDTTSDGDSVHGDVRLPLTREMLAMISGRIVARSAASDTNSEAVASTIVTLRVNSVAPQDTVSAPSTEDEDVEGGGDDVAPGDDELLDEAGSARGDAHCNRSDGGAPTERGEDFAPLLGIDDDRAS